MSTYKVADGSDVALESLNDLSRQPTSDGIKSTRRTYSANSSVYDEAKYVELRFSAIDSVTVYQTLLGEFGVQSALTNAVTVYVRDETFAWVRMNGTAVRPEPGRDVRWDNYFPRNVTILVKDLVTAA